MYFMCSVSFALSKIATFVISIFLVFCTLMGYVAQLLTHLSAEFYLLHQVGAV